MIGYYRQTFIKLSKLTRRLEVEESKIELCHEIQMILIQKIRHVESRIRLWKKFTPKSDESNQKIKSYQRISKTLRYFGDAIAFTFIDRWDIKPLSMNNVPGFISDKSGFQLEHAIFKQTYKVGVPSLLADLTNWLRHGDVYCFSPNRKPLIIEAKDGYAKKSGRSSKQKQRLNQKVNYLNTGEKDYQGYLMKRASLPSEIIDNSEIISHIASEALHNGVAWVNVKNQVSYLAVTKFDSAVFEEAARGFKKPFLFTIRSDEYYLINYPYYPIVLVIKDPVALAEFLSARMIFFVILDLFQFEEAIRMLGAKINFTEDGDEKWAASIKWPNIEEMKISHGMFCRLFYEFLDVSWFARIIAELPKESVVNYLEKN